MRIVNACRRRNVSHPSLCPASRTQRAPSRSDRFFSVPPWRSRGAPQGRRGSGATGSLRLARPPSRIGRYRTKRESGDSPHPARARREEHDQLIDPPHTRPRGALRVAERANGLPESAQSPASAQSPESAQSTNGRSPIPTRGVGTSVPIGTVGGHPCVHLSPSGAGWPPTPEGAPLEAWGTGRSRPAFRQYTVSNEGSQ